MNNYIFYQGDSLDVMRNLIKQGEYFNAIITDPPYKILKHKLESDYNEREFAELCYALADYVVIFGAGVSMWRQNLALVESGFLFKENLIWDKKNTSMPGLPTSRKHENINIFAKKDFKINRIYLHEPEEIDELGYLNKLIPAMKDILKKYDTYKGKIIKNWLNGLENRIYLNKLKNTNDDIWNKYYEYDNIYISINQLDKGFLCPSILKVSRPQKDRIHPTQKPELLLNILIKLVCNNKKVKLLDPFSGSGSLARSAFQTLTSSTIVSIERDEEYLKKAINSLELGAKTIWIKD